MHRAQRPSARKVDEDRERDQCSVIRWSESRHLQIKMHNESCIVVVVVVFVTSCCWLWPCKHIVAQAVCSHLEGSIVSISKFLEMVYDPMIGDHTAGFLKSVFTTKTVSEETTSCVSWGKTYWATTLGGQRLC